MAPHAPHDDVYDIAISPDFANDQTLYVVCRDMFLRSTDGGGTWKNLVTGLNNMSWFFTDKTQRFSLSISHHNKSVLYFASRGDGVYRSINKGLSWSKLDTGEDLDIRLVAISPHSSDVVLAATAPGGLLKTADGGDTWQPVRGIGSQVSAISFSADDEDLVFIGDEHGTLSLSEDGGIRWRTTPVPDAGQIRSIAVSPSFTSDKTIVLGTAAAGVFRSTDSGASFSPANGGLGDLCVSSVVFSLNDNLDSTLWVSTWTEGVFVSHDRATSWTHSSVGLTTNEQKDEEAFHDRPHFGRLLLAGTQLGAETHGALYLAGFDGLFHSSDGGQSWIELETLPSNLVVSLAVSPDFSNDSSVALTTYVNGAFLSEDGGDTWKSINHGLEQRSMQERAPDYIARLFGIVFSPSYATDNTIFCALWTRFLRSQNRAKKWTRVELDAGPNPRNQKIITAVSADYARDKTIFLANRYGDIYKSTDGGVEFFPIVNLGGHIRALVISPEYSIDGTLFAGAGTRPNEVHATFDGGTTWTPAGEGIGFVTHLAISPEYGRDQTLFAGTRTGLLMTKDRGQSWERLAQAENDTGTHQSLDYVEAIALSPDFANDGTMLISVSGRGLFRSVDRGQTFGPVGAELLENNQVFANIPNPVASPIVFSPDYATDRTIFGYSPTNVLRSTDAGDTWTDITQPKLIHATGGRIKAAPALHAASQSTVGRRLKSAARRLADRW